MVNSKMICEKRLRRSDSSANSHDIGKLKGHTWSSSYEVGERVENRDHRSIANKQLAN